MKISFNQIRKLEPCWSNDKLREYLPTKTRVEVTLQSLQKLTIRDARWLVSRLMTRPQLIVWAQTCAKRAKKYAAWAAAWAAAADAAADAAWAAAAADAAAAWAAAAADAADAAAWAAAAWAAAWAAWAAAAADADVKENKIAMKHAVALLNGKGMK